MTSCVSHHIIKYENFWFWNSNKLTFFVFKHDLTIQNRIYREGFTRKKSKTAILLYCFHTAGVLHIFMLYNLLGPGISFFRKSQIIVKRKPNYEIGWFHNDQWSFHIDSMPFTLQTMIFRYNYKSIDFFLFT